MVFGPSKSGSSPLLSAEGTIFIKDKAAIRERWKEHFSQLLNRPSSVDPTVLDPISQRALIEDRDDPPSLDEVRKAIKHMSNGKAPGRDAEIFKALSNEALQTFHGILISIWEMEEMPADFRDATIVALLKNKGSRADCGNHRGISLLSTAGKI